MLHCNAKLFNNAAEKWTEKNNGKPTYVYENGQNNI